MADLKELDIIIMNAIQLKKTAFPQWAGGGFPITVNGVDYTVEIDIERV